jgi:outer membrane protein assembly factor BamB
VTSVDPAQIGPYRILRRLGGGGMGHVYLAASASGRAVAVKVIRPEFSAEPGFRRRFRAEVDAARAVSGAFTTPVVDADPDGQPPWLATAYVAGPSLQEAVRADGPLPEQSLRVLGAGIAEALLAVHRAGLIHRDLKPGNILLAGDGPRVIDFGISRALDATSHTVDGEILGSAGYMSPEHAAGLDLTPASDVFSFGAVLAYAARGEGAFGTGPFQVLLFRALHEAPQLDRVPPALADLVAACLHKDPGQRPPVDWLARQLAGTPGVSGWLPPNLRNAVWQREQEQTVAIAAARRPVVSRRAVLIGGSALLTAGVAAGAYAILAPSRGTPAAPQLAWTGTLPNPDVGPYQSASGNTTLVCASLTEVHAFDLITGHALWNDAGAGDTSIFGDAERIYPVRDDGKVYALDQRTGRQLWVSAPSGNEAPTAVLSSRGTLVVRDNQRRLYAVDAATGDPRWTHQSPSSSYQQDGVTANGLLISHGSSSYEQWKQAGGGYGRNLGSHYALSMDTGEVRWSKDKPLEGVCVPPVGDVLYAVDDKNTMVALRAAGGDPVWESPTRYSSTGVVGFLGTITLHGDTLVCFPSTGFQGSKGSIISAFDVATGRALWTLDTPESSGLAVRGQTLCYFDNGLKAVDLRTGQARWTAGADLAPKLQFLWEAGGLFLAGTLDDANGQGGLYGWDAATGQQVWHYPVVTNAGDTTRWNAAEVGGYLVASYAGTMFAFRLAGNAPA